MRGAPPVRSSRERGGLLAPGAWLAAAALTAALGAPVGPDLRAQEGGGGPQDDPGFAPERLADPDEAEALARFRAAAEASDAPLDWYNYGTALLGLGRWEQAREALRRAASTESPRVGLFSRYNHALASAESGHRGPGQPEERRERLLEARNTFRAVLRRDPADEDARWNLELVQRWLRQQQGGGGGGAGAGQAPSSGAGSGLPQGGDQAGDPVQLGPGEAEELLSAAGRAESAVRDRLLGRARLRDPVVERNW